MIPSAQYTGVPPPSSRSPAANSDGRSTSRATAPGGRVLLVDDEPLVSRALARVLRRAGWEVVIVEGGEEALGSVRADPDIDVVVSDISMPRMDGLALLQRLRATQPDLPVILLTGLPGFETAVEAIALGAYRYLVKPIEPGALCEAVTDAAASHAEARRRRAFLSQLQAQDIEAQELHATLDEVLETLWLAFQPIVDTERRAIVAYEVLLRSRSERLPHPGAVLEAAERLGRLPDVGRAVRQAAAQQMDQVPPDADVFVNLHPLDFADPDLFDPSAPLSRHARRVILEITERGALEGLDGLEERVEQLRALGYRLAIDDMGAGYAGLSSFVRFSPDVVKVDMSLVRDIHRDEVKQRIVHSLLHLCRTMGIPVVIEGVEIREEASTLVAMGAALLQGYWFGKPQAEVTRELRRAFP